MNQFVTIALFGLFAIVSANNHADGGHSTINRHQDASGKYGFGYQITDPRGSSNYRQESGDGWGNVAGSYGLKLADGRQRNVNYVADKNGFRVKLDSNEPSVDSIDAADAIYNGADPSGHSVTYVPSGNNGRNNRYDGSWEGGYQQRQFAPIYHQQNGRDSWNNKDSWKSGHQQQNHDNWARN